MATPAGHQAAMSELSSKNDCRHCHTPIHNCPSNRLDTFGSHLVIFADVSIQTIFLDVCFVNWCDARHPYMQNCPAPRGAHFEQIPPDLSLSLPSLSLSLSLSLSPVLLFLFLSLSLSLSRSVFLSLSLSLSVSPSLSPSLSLSLPLSLSLSLSLCLPHSYDLQTDLQDGNSARWTPDPSVLGL